MALKIIYTIFLGILLAVFIGVGIAAFYPAPNYDNYPEYPRELSNVDTCPLESRSPCAKFEGSSLTPPTDEQKQIYEDYQKEVKAYEEMQNRYGRNVSIIAVGFAILFFVLSLVFVHKLDIISDGILLGGVLTLLYSIGWGIATQDNKFRFFIVTFGVLIALILGYYKFVRPQAKK